MDIITGSMSTLLPKLARLLVGEYKLHKGVKGEIEELEKELEGMYAALRKVSEVPADQLDELAKMWARDVRELSYDIEDKVDTFMLQGKQGHDTTKPLSFKGLIDRATNLFKKAKSNHDIHNAIKDIINQVKKVSERRDRYKVDGIAASARPNIVPVDPRLEAMYRKVTELVGIDRPKNELAKRLLEHADCSSRQQPNIVSIFGFGGVGKTTLANVLLQDLKAKFDCHFIVSVSHKPDIKMILKNILDQLDETKYSCRNEPWDDMQLINKIRELLKHRRCLCIIDDVWKESAWDTIKLALQDAKHGSKILITTRKKAIAEHAGGVVFELQPLSNDDSRKLLNMRIFGSEDGCPSDLSKVSGEALKKCGGVPLAIITTASLLASRPKQLLEWEKVNKSIGTGPGDSLGVDKMRKILSLSYYDLPPHLRTCLLYLSKYPEDEEIRKDVLIWSWIAEGFITEQITQPTGTSLQEIGESYFNELINRSLIQPVNIHHLTRQDGQVHACRVHDMVLELINQLSNEEGFITTLSDAQQAGTGTTLSAAQKRKIRRLSLHCSNENDSYASEEAREQLSKVRSLTVFGRVDSVPHLLSCFHVLRVLQLEDCTGFNSNHLNNLGEFRHLRFLRLRKYTATELPECIGKLESLETLDIRGSKTVVLLPMSFVKLQKLVRLFTGRFKLPDRLALGDMRSLRKLAFTYFTLEVMEGIGHLKELRILRVFVNFDDIVDNPCNLAKSILMCLQRCTNLQDLDIRTNGPISCSFDVGQQVPPDLQRFMMSMCMTAFPSWIDSSVVSGLTTLSIALSVDCLLPQHLEKLAELPSLLFLRLEVTGNWKRQRLSIPDGACAFRCLRDFHFICPSMFLKFQPGAMPELQGLCLWFYYHLETDNLSDFGLENLHSLRHVIIECLDLGVVPVYHQDVEAAFWEALKDIPNHPSLELLF